MWRPVDASAAGCVDVVGPLVQSRGGLRRGTWGAVVSAVPIASAHHANDDAAARGGSVSFSVSRTSGAVWVGLTSMGLVDYQASVYHQRAWFVAWCPDGEVVGCFEKGTGPQLAAHTVTFGPGDRVSYELLLQNEGGGTTAVVTLFKNGVEVHRLRVPHAPDPTEVHGVAFLGAPNVVVQIMS